MLWNIISILATARLAECDEVIIKCDVTLAADKISKTFKIGARMMKENSKHKNYLSRAG